MKNKYLMISLILIILVFIVTIVYFIQNNYREVKVSSKAKVIEKFETEDSFLLVIGDTLCSGCKEYKNTTLKEYIKKEQTYPLYFLYKDDSFSSLEDFKNFKETFNLIYDGSPTTYLVIDGVVVAYYDPYMTITELYEFIEVNS